MDRRTIPCAECEAPVRPSNGYLGGDILCLDCMEQLKDENTIHD